MVNTVKGWNSPYTIKKFTKFILTIIIVALHSTMAEETSVNSSSINSVTANDLNEDDCATTIPQILPTDVTIQNEASLPPIDHGTKNGMQIEFQNCLSMICYAPVSTKTMRTEEIISNMCEQLLVTPHGWVTLSNLQQVKVISPTFSIACLQSLMG